jgi:ribosomal protein S18 acetylase RimI-like enzyme
MKFIEVKPEDKNYIEQIIEIEKEAFGVSGGVDEWILKPIIRYGKVYVLLLKGEVIGISEYIRSFDGEEIFLYGFSVKKKYRKHGYGKKMLEESVKIFKENKIKRISLTVGLENQEAIELYKKLKFENKKLLKDEYGKGIDRLYFVRAIK